MKKLFVVGMTAASLGVGISDVSAQAYRPGMLGVDTNLRARQYTPPPAPPPPVVRPTYTPPPRTLDLRPPSIVNPPAPNPNVVRPLPPLPPAPAPAPQRFEGEEVVVPTPTGGAAGSGVLRDNKNGLTFEGHGRTEPGGGTSATGAVTKDIP